MAEVTSTESELPSVEDSEVRHNEIIFCVTAVHDTYTAARLIPLPSLHLRRDGGGEEDEEVQSSGSWATQTVSDHGFEEESEIERA